MIVVGFEGDEFVLLSDGTLRRADKPKKKKFKHIAKTNTVCLSVAEKLAEGRAANALIKNALKDFNNPEETEGEDF